MKRLPERYPPAHRGTVVVWGLMANLPVPGIVWQALHHVAGLRRLGFDVWYVEDTDGCMSRPGDLYPTTDATENVACLADWMAAIGLPDRWILRPPGQNETFGHPRAQLDHLYATAEAAFNLCASVTLEDRHAAVRRLVLLETDPVESQVRVANGDASLAQQLSLYHHRFTYGQNLGADDCPIPLCGLDWEPTRPPVCVDWWASDGPAPSGAPLTTVVNWSTTGRQVTWNGETYRWRKDLAFQPLLDLPARSPLPLELAVVNLPDEQRRLMRERGWRTRSATTLAEPDAYRDYLRASAGEISPSKEQYVRPRSGWFSDRSVCYLAAGRPVVTEETGFSKFVPVGEGLFAFSNPDEAAEAITAVADEPERHRQAARQLAREHFAAERVLGDVARKVGLL